MCSLENSSQHERNENPSKNDENQPFKNHQINQRLSLINEVLP